MILRNSNSFSNILTLFVVVSVIMQCMYQDIETITLFALTLTHTQINPEQKVRGCPVTQAKENINCFTGHLLGVEGPAVLSGAFPPTSDRTDALQ